MIGIFAVQFGYIFLAILSSFSNPKKIVIQGFAQGATYQVTYFEKDSVVRKQEIEIILNKIDSSLSLYKPYSLINQFNASESGVETDDLFKTVVEKSLDVFRKTEGLFDITVGSLTAAWGFSPQKPAFLPDSGGITNILQCVGSKYLRYDGKIWRKSKPCIKLDMNGIAQGYTVDLIAEYLSKKGINNYVVEISGEIRIKGRKPNGAMMNVAIESPELDEYGLNLQQKVLNISEGAITTSGNYRKFYESNGKKISHIINPITGYTQNNTLISVTVFAKDAITADAYDNALMLMGLEDAIKFADKSNEIEAYFIYKCGSKICDTSSAAFLSSLTTH